MYKPGDIIELIEPVRIAPVVYSRFLNLSEYPVGTLFKIISISRFSDNRHGLRLIFNGGEILQEGLSSGCTHAISEKYYKLHNSKRQKLLNALQKGQY